MKVVILCGGLGTRLREETELRPKPMVEIGGRPILWHIMRTYARAGFGDFVLCLGYKGSMIKEYFYEYEVLSNDFTIDLGTSAVTVHREGARDDWRITLAETGLNAKTGARIKRAAKYIDTDTFMVTYGDGVTDLDIGALVRFHESHGRIGTVTGVCPPSRYGELRIDGEQVLNFAEKPDLGGGFINGGYFIFKRAFLNYLSDDDECILERTPLERLATEGQLMVYAHRGFWQCMDTFRDLEYLKDLWAGGRAPWRS